MNRALLINYLRRPRAPVGGVASAFTPLSLTPALWLDPSDTTTMFQSNAGTTTVTDTSVCGYAGDKSGNAFHLTSTADDTTRPTWNNNGGLPYLNFNGTNQLLRRAADLGLHTAARATGFTVSFAVRGNPAGLSERLFSMGNTLDPSPLFVTNGGGAATASDQVCQYRNDAGGAQDIALLPVLANAYDNTDNVVTITDSGSVVTAYLDGAGTVTQSYTDSGVYTLNVTALAAFIRSTTSGWMRCRVYDGVAVKRVITAGERANLVTYQGAKMGRVL